MLFRGYNFSTNEPIVIYDDIDFEFLYKYVSDADFDAYDKKIANCRKFDQDQRASIANKNWYKNWEIQTEISNNKEFDAIKKYFLISEVRRAQVNNSVYLGRQSNIIYRILTQKV